jgi:hypothetical protein
MLHRTKILLVAVCAAMATIAITSAASAQVRSQRHVDVESIYDFEDDDLLAAGLGAMGAVLKVRKGAARVQLLRPRTHFVPEMLKSVEHI